MQVEVLALIAKLRAKRSGEPCRQEIAVHGASIDRVRIQIEFKPAVNDGAPALEPATARQRQRQVRESQSAVFPVEAGLQALNRNQLAIEGACALIAHTEFAAHGRSVRRFALQHRIDIE